MNGMPPHIAQLVAGHRDINTTMGYKAVYPEEVINGHRAFIARRRGLRPSEEYRTPTDEEWEEFLGHFERRRVALGEPAAGPIQPLASTNTAACVAPCCDRRPPNDHGSSRSATTYSTGSPRPSAKAWLGEVEGLQVSLAGAEAKLAQLDQMVRRAATIHLGMPSFSEIAGRTATFPKDHP